jgi:hypothetical protein
LGALQRKAPHNCGRRFANGGYFWYQRVPVTQRDLRRIDPNHPLAILGDMAIQACPPTLAQMQPIAQARDKLR